MSDVLVSSVETRPSSPVASPCSVTSSPSRASTRGVRSVGVGVDMVVGAPIAIVGIHIPRLIIAHLGGMAAGRVQELKGLAWYYSMSEYPSHQHMAGVQSASDQ